MAINRSWAAHQPTYRAREMKTLAGWIQAGMCGSVVGMGGAGKSNLLGFLCHHLEALESYLPSGFRASPVALIPVDLNILPANNLSTLYRLILRSFYEVRDRFDPELQQTITNLYRENRTERDPFLPQSALRELLLLFQNQNVRVILVLDRFDNFCQVATPQMADTLRGLRDSFKDTLCYIVGMRQEVAYLSDPLILGELYELLDSHVCWVGPMAETDARQLIAQETHTAQIAPAESEITTLLTLTGGYPALLKATCHWWQTSPQARPPVERWLEILLAKRTIQFRLEEIWEGQTQEEQIVLSEVQKLQARADALITAEERDDGQPSKSKKEALDKAFTGLDKQHHYALTRLAAKGLCREARIGWRIFSDLLAAYIADVGGRGGGKIWLDQESDVLYQNKTPVEGLSPLEGAVLRFLVRHPRTRHAKTDLIINTWPDELRRQGVTDDSLYQVASELRKKIEPNPAKPCYLVTWRGKPEGGYQFFPEGRPG